LTFSLWSLLPPSFAQLVWYVSISEMVTQSLLTSVTSDNIGLQALDRLSLFFLLRPALPIEQGNDQGPSTASYSLSSDLILFSAGSWFRELGAQLSSNGAKIFCRSRYEPAYRGKQGGPRTRSRWASRRHTISKPIPKFW
jgi:hypothetical protein